MMRCMSFLSSLLSGLVLVFMPINTQTKYMRSKTILFKRSVHIHISKILNEPRPKKTIFCICEYKGADQLGSALLFSLNG